MSLRKLRPKSDVVEKGFHYTGANLHALITLPDFKQSRFSVTPTLNVTIFTYDGIGHTDEIAIKPNQWLIFGRSGWKMMTQRQVDENYEVENVLSALPKPTPIRGTEDIEKAQAVLRKMWGTDNEDFGLESPTYYLTNEEV